MPRPATGQVVEPKGRQKSWALRFRAYGKRRFVTLGKPEDGWNRERAEAELRHVLADVERGIWHPYKPEPVEAPPEEPTFHEFASEWLERRKPELRPKTVKSYEWQLAHHLLPWFQSYPLSRIKAANVDDYKVAKLREGAIGPNQINKTVGTLALILDDAIDRGCLDGANPARGRRRRVKPTTPSRPRIEPEQLPTLLDVARPEIRIILATLAGTGMRDGEACALNWSNVNLASGTIRVRESKTDAGVREVDVPLALREELSDLKARTEDPAPDSPVFVNGEGRRQTVNNLGRRLKTAIRRANRRLAEIGIEPIDVKASPYSMRRLWSSLRYALGDDPVYISAQIGHKDSGELSRSVYASAFKRRERLTGATLREFDRALDWAVMGSGTLEEGVQGAHRLSRQYPANGLAEPNLTTSPDSSAG